MEHPDTHSFRLAAVLRQVEILEPLAIVNTQIAQHVERRVRAAVVDEQKTMRRFAQRVTNKRLDVCELAICNDMRETIRRELAAGRPSDDIIYFFRNRYGDRVLAELPKSGFNLLLWGWVAASMALVTAGGALGLYRLRQGSSPRRGPPSAGAV